MVWPWPPQRRSSLVVCHFCNTTLDLVTPLATVHDLKGKGKSRTYDRPVAVGASTDWWCGNCGCRSHFDQNGEIISDEPAHHDSDLNTESFLRRATPSRTQLTSSLNKPSLSPFCRTCLSNQSLQIHLLASYTSSEDDDIILAGPPSSNTNRSTRSRSPDLASYQHSLDARYPLVCADCLPHVETLIRQRDYRAKAGLLASRLRESQAVKREREEYERRRRSSWAWWCMGMLWGVRGGLWCATWVVVILAGAAASLDPLRWQDRSCPVWVPILAAVSLLWTNWDPTWLRARRYALLGRPMDVLHRPTFILIQMLAYTARLILSTLIYLDHLRLSRNLALVIITAFALAFFVSLRTIRIVPRPVLRLGRTKPLSANPPVDPLDPISSLSLSNDGLPSPISTPSSSLLDGGLRNRKLPPTSIAIPGPRKPVDEPRFGQPWISTPPSVQAFSLDDDGDGDVEMDSIEASPSSRKTDEGLWVRFGPSRAKWGWIEPKSGLEEVFEERMKVDGDGDDEGIQKAVKEDDAIEGRKRRDSGWLSRWFGVH